MSRININIIKTYYSSSFPEGQRDSINQLVSQASIKVAGSVLGFCDLNAGVRGPIPDRSELNTGAGSLYLVYPEIIIGLTHHQLSVEKLDILYQNNYIDFISVVTISEVSVIEFNFKLVIKDNPADILATGVYQVPFFNQDQNKKYITNLQVISKFKLIRLNYLISSLNNNNNNITIISHHTFNPLI